MLSPIVKVIRIASFVICLIVIGSFVAFAADQTKSASNHQTEELGERPASSSSASGGASKHENGFHKALEEASRELTSPFAGIVSGSSSEWLIRSVKLILALLVYGFGLGFLARALRVRV